MRLFVATAGAAALAAVSMPIKADAKVIAFSSLQITNFGVTSGAEVIDAPGMTVVNTTTSSAVLGGIGHNYSAPTNGPPGTIGLADSDVPQSCAGDCGGVGQNNYNSVAAANPGWEFARSDARLAGSILVPGGLNLRTVAEAQLIAPTSASGTGAIQSISNVSTIEFTAGQSGDISLTFDVLGELFALSDEAGGVALVDIDLGFELRDITNGGVPINIGVTSLNGAADLDPLNAQRSVIGVEQQSYLVSDRYTLTFSDLLSDATYRLQFTQFTDISASLTREPAEPVPEPGSLVLLGAGLLGFGGLLRRRRGGPRRISS